MLRNNKIENERQLGLLNFFWGGEGGGWEVFISVGWNGLNLFVFLAELSLRTTQIVHRQWTVS